MTARWSGICDRSRTFGSCHWNQCTFLIPGKENSEAVNEMPLKDRKEETYFEQNKNVN